MTVNAERHSPQKKRVFARRRTQMLGNVVLIVTAVAFCLVVMEFAARRIFADIGTSGDRNTYFSKRWYAQHPLTMNRLGFRERSFSSQPAPGVLRIANIGDSFTFGVGILPEERISNLIETEMNDGGPPRFEVLNFGQPGANYERHVTNMELALENAKPGFILLQWYLNDVDDPDELRPRPKQLGWLLHAQLSEMSALYMVTFRVFSDLQIKLGLIDVDEYYARFVDPEDPISVRADDRFLKVVDVARAAGIPIGVYIWPELTRPIGSSPNDAIIRRLLMLCDAEAIDCIDLSPVLKQEPRHERLIVNRFDTHASAYANRLSAHLLIERFGHRWTGRAETKLKSGRASLSQPAGAIPK